MSFLDKLGPIKDLPGMIQKLLPFLKTFGIDPQSFIGKMERAQVEPRFMAGIPTVAARMEKEGNTPAAKAHGGDAERIFIRDAMYLLGKEAFKGILPSKFAVLVPKAADFLRDQHDDAVVARVSPVLTETTPMQDALKLIVHEYVEHIF